MRIKVHRLGKGSYRIVWLIVTTWRPLYISINRCIARYRPWLGFEVAFTDEDFYDSYLKLGEHNQ